MRRTQIPIGPQHPLLKEPLALTLEVAGERVESASLRLGYVHRGIERLCQEKTFLQDTHLIERVCGICSHVHTTAYCQAIETLLGLEIPLRAAYVRVLLCELERIHSHLLWLGVLAEAVGFTTVFMYTWRDREIILDLMEDLSGGRVSHSVNVIGGVRVDITPALRETLQQGLTEFTKQMELFTTLIQRDRSLRVRTHGLGKISLEEAHALGVVGPMARASGCSLDLRMAAPYAAYPHLDLNVISATDGDVWSRTQVRVQEMHESLSLCRQVLEQIPDGTLTVRAPRRVPAGEVIMRVEAPRGELFYYVRSDGTDHPARIKIRTPTMPSLHALERLLPGLQTADVAAVVAGTDLCIACADR